MKSYISSEMQQTARVVIRALSESPEFRDVKIVIVGGCALHRYLPGLNSTNVCDLPLLLTRVVFKEITDFFYFNRIWIYSSISEINGPRKGSTNALMASRNSAKITFLKSTQRNSGASLTSLGILMPLIQVCLSFFSQRKW